MRDLLRSQGDASLLGLIEKGKDWMLMLQDRNLTSHTYQPRHGGCYCGSDHQLLFALLSAVAHQARATVSAGSTLNIPAQAVERLLAVLTAQPQGQSLWLFGSRAMGREQPGSDVDLCLEAPQLSHSDWLRLMNDLDDLCLPSQVDLVLRHELPAELEAHLQRVGRCLWTQP